MLNGKKRYPSLSPANASRGMVLIIVLWSLFFLSALALAIAAYVRPQISLAGRLKDKAVARVLAEAGVKRAMAQISNGIGANADTLKEFVPGGLFDFKSQGAGSGEFYYELVDEGRKININTAPEDVLKRFFEIVAGLDTQHAEDMAAAILDWRQPGEQARQNGAKSNYYQTLNPSYPCKGGPFDVLEEVLLVKGMTPGIYKNVSNEITIYGTGCININTVDKPVLKSLGMTDALADKIIDYRNGNDGLPATNDDHSFSDAVSFVSTLKTSQQLTQDEVNQLTNIFGEGLLCARSDYYKGKSYGKNNRELLVICFVFNRQGNIRFWREE